MPLTVEQFRNTANTAFFTSRDVVVTGERTQLGNLVFSHGKKTNDATMAAFREALEREYGVFGAHAFEMVLGRRAQTHKSLRACDVTATLSQLSSVKSIRFAAELGRQLDTNPKFRMLTPEMRSIVRSEVFGASLGRVDVSSCQTQDDIDRLAFKHIASAIDKTANKIVDGVAHEGVDHTSHAIDSGGKTETEAQESEPTGLKNLGNAFRKGSTSVEDKIKSGRLGPGMQVNRSRGDAVLLEKVKTNGVEPGYIFRNDWSQMDTEGMMMQIDSDASRAAMEQLLAKNPGLREKCEGKPLREQILIAGRAHPAGMSAVAEMLLEEAAKFVLCGEDEKKMTVSAGVKKLAVAMKNHFGYTNDIKNLAENSQRPAGRRLMDEAKSELFLEIRSAVLNAKTTDAEYSRSPVFKHFAERNIMKLDYNEGDRVWKKDAASAGSFQRPERIISSRGAIIGRIYRLQTASGADSISSGAVTEALANDLTRIAGVPSQELEIVRGEYSDGHPKLMLRAKFKAGYSDMENGMIKDGRVIAPGTEKLGKYKAFFLVTADRDGVGSRGQNKGFANGKFFAIDPGHSLEGNGKYLEIKDDLSFKDTYGFSLKPRFNNFSVFDDDTRFSKFEGILNLRETAKSGAFTNLFNDYRAKFNPNEPGISDAEKALRTKICEDIKTKENEFNENLSKVLKVGGMQLELWDDLADEPKTIREGAIETIANLEKLTSPTTWVSKHGKVALKHLEVVPETRTPWRAFAEGDNIVYQCEKPMSDDTRSLLETLVKAGGAQIETDAMGVTKITVPKATADKAFAVLSEESVQKVTHPQEYAERMEGGTGLKSAKTYKPPKPAAPQQRQPASFTLPDKLEISLKSGDKITLNKTHYENMVSHASGDARPSSVDELKRMLKARFRRGEDILRALAMGKVNRYEATAANVVALTLALHAKALAKNDYIYRGSFSVSDPDGHIAKWLDSAQGLYQRTSTHAKPYQDMRVDGHLNMPRGFDVAEGMNGMLNGMRTFHFFTIPDQNHLQDAGGSGPKRRLFLKCETYGVFVNTIHAKTGKKADSRSEGMNTRSYQFGDVCESIAHGMSLFASFFTSKTAGGIRKENIPPQLKGILDDMRTNLRNSKFAHLENRIFSEDVSEGGGVRKFLDNVVNTTSKMTGKDMNEFLDFATPFLDRLETELNKLNGDVEQRLGNEVMLELEDLV